MPQVYFNFSGRLPTNYLFSGLFIHDRLDVLIVGLLGLQLVKIQLGEGTALLGTFLRVVLARVHDQDGVSSVLEVGFVWISLVMADDFGRAIQVDQVSFAGDVEGERLTLLQVGPPNLDWRESLARLCGQNHGVGIGFCIEKGVS